MKLVYQNTISRLYEKIIGNLSNVHTQDLNDFIYSAQMKGLHQFHIILQSTYMKFSYTRHIPSYTLQQCGWSQRRAYCSVHKGGRGPTRSGVRLFTHELRREREQGVAGRVPQICRTLPKTSTAPLYPAFR